MQLRTEVRPHDWLPQYRLWRSATDELSRCWASSPRNAWALFRDALGWDGARVYAEVEGSLVGYASWHPPVRFAPQPASGAIGEFTALPAFEGGLLLPFGYPWTWPIDDALRATLYDASLRGLEGALARLGEERWNASGGKPRAMVQRFRASWVGPRMFMEDRGWQDLFRRDVWVLETEHAEVGYVGEAPDDPLATFVEASGLDPLTPKVDRATLEQSVSGGWLDPSMIHAVREGDRLVGAFSLSIRELWSELHLFASAVGSETLVMDAATRVARQLGAAELGFVLRPDQKERAAQLAALGFEVRDLDVFMARAL